jgi:N-acetylneuraminate synthase/sialic acid synthase
MYERDYDNPNSYGATYGEHRDYLEFELDEHKALLESAKQNQVEFLSTPFDIPSVDFLEDLDIPAYKIASGDLTNPTLLDYVARLGKPMFISTGAATMDEIKIAYETVLKHHDQLCILHCTAGYPAEYDTLNLRMIPTLKEAFPEAIIGYSGHDLGILAPAIAYMLGAAVVEKHFTMNRAWKGTDHKFSLEPTGMHKMVRDLHRVDMMLGDGVKHILDFEWEARKKMGKSLYTAHALKAGSIISEQDIVLKSPGGGLPPYQLLEIIGRKLVTDLGSEEQILLEHVE